ncbi:MAG: RNA-directed DNA polymerase, partial [Proteobacteria bacterium]|nr:RNA-directed DNA polymerase [Pseudomonadota bacterium]
MTEKMALDLASLRSAFQSVKANHGCAGVDRVTIERFEERLDKNLRTLQHKLTTQTYSPFPLLKFLVDKGKGDGEARALCVPVVRDRVVQTAALKIIEPVLEKEFEECSFAYRKGRSVKHAVYKIKEYYDKGYRWVINADIDAFFDNVEHRLLLEKFKQYVHEPGIHRLVEQWLNVEVWDGISLTRLEKGIPQGSPISPIMANLFLDELDEKMLKKDYKFVRYADDFIVLCKKPHEARSALEFAKEVLDKLLLKLDEEEVVTFEHGFKYLGVYFVRSLIMTPFDRPKREHKVL